MRLWGALILLAATAGAKRPEAKKEVPFEAPQGWQATPAQKTETAAAPVEDHVWELQSKEMRGQVVVYAGKVSDGELETAAAERHSARVKNRVAWGMKAQAGPPRESLRIGGRRAVRWRDRVGGALGQSEQLMTCVVAGARLACVVLIGPDDLREQADAAAAQILASLRR